MTTPEPSPRFTAEQVRAVEADIRRLNALSGGEEHEIADMLDAFADLLEARAAKPEPSPLSEQDLKALEEYTRSLVCCVCDGPDSDGDHDDDCQAPFWQKVSRAIAQARAARPSPTCGTCLHDANCEIQEAAGNYSNPAFSCAFHEPAPPAQDGGRS